MSVQLALDMDAPATSEPLGDPTLNRIAYQALTVLVDHSGTCTKGCEHVPPLRCPQGWRLREAERAAQYAWRATIDPKRLEAIRERVQVWVEIQRSTGADWFRNGEQP